MAKNKRQAIELTKRRSVHVGIGNSATQNGHAFALGENEPYFCDHSGVPIYDHPIYGITSADTGDQLDLVPGKIYRATLEPYTDGKGLHYPQMRGTIRHRGSFVPVTFRINKRRHI